MKLLVVTAAIILVANALSIDQHWNEFKRKHGKSYKSLFEERQRYKIFQDNLRAIEKHNERYARGEVSFKQGITDFADTTGEEFESLLFKIKVDKLGYQTVRDEENALLPTSINWAKNGAVTEPRFQRNCGSCWAITVAEAVEGRVFIETGKLKELSPQNLLDCSKAFGNDGCSGGNFQSAFNYIEDNGILLEKEYPYIGKDGSCRKTGGVTVNHYVNIQNNPKDMEYFIAKTGPICAAMSVNVEIQHYKEGIIDSRVGCGNTNETLNHGVLVVGYGSDNGTNYWIIKNSWGSHWGEKGFFRLKKGDDNVCGINLGCSFPVL